MADEPYDFAILGSSLAAMMLAGLLAEAHGKRVILVGRPPSGLRLPRVLDLLLMPATRPESWALFAQAAGEIGGTLTKIGAPDALGHLDVAVEAELDASAERFDHVAHMASAHGVPVRREERGWLFRGLPWLDRAMLRQKLPAWLEAKQVAIADADDHALSFGKAGAQIDGVAAERIAICDDEVVLQLPEEARPRALYLRHRVVTLLEPVKPGKAPVLIWPDRGVSLVRRDDKQALAFVEGTEEADARLASVLSTSARRLAAGQSRHLVTGDGAPLVGALPKTNLFLAAGLGNVGAFLAPTLARLLGGASRAEEREWVKAYDPSRSDGGRASAGGVP